MERRRFITQSLIGLPVLLSKSSLWACSSHSTNTMTVVPKSVIVIGAGISGLAAAKKLKDNGFTVTVLEAQSKVGGRLRTDRSLGVAFDEGASWIHGTTNNPMTTLAQQAGMTTAFTDDDSFIAYDINSTEISDTTFGNTETQYYAMMDTLKNSGSTSQSFETVFNSLHPTRVNDRLWKFFLSTYTTFDRGDLNNLSSLYYDEGLEFGGEERISTNGYDTIPNYLATGLTIQLNQRVTSINYANTKVVVTHNGTNSEADYILVTVPLGVLKANVISFTPTLPTVKQTAIQKVGMNCVNKFLLTWDTAFWDNEQYIAYTPEARNKFNYFVNVKKFAPSVNALMTFAYADYGRQTESMTDAAVIDAIMAHLKDIYGNSIPNPTNMLRTKWDTNENSYGAYSYTAVETQMQHFDDLAENINDKVFFAGEHTHIDYFSTAHGAYLSGIREADKIIALGVTLPVELLTFEAQHKNSKIHLNWATAVEDHTESFTIEQSRDGQVFMPISTVKAKGANAFYEFIDQSFFVGANYYRLKINDFGDKSNYSKIVSVVMDNQIANLKVFPTIVNDNLTISNQQGNILDFQIIDVAGQVIARKNNAIRDNNGQLTLNLSHLATGIYVIKAQNTEGGITTVKFIKN